MARVNPEIDILRRQVAMLQRDLDERRKDPGDLPLDGCADNSCVVAAPVGMGTNGVCRCDERKLRMAMRWWKRRAAFLEETIRTMKDES